VLTGGWQTSKETAYVEATRARNGTDWYIARDDLGNEGQDAARITRLAQQMCNSRAQTPSLSHPELPDHLWGTGFDLGPLRPLRLARQLVPPARNLNRTRDDSADRGR
jgi:hypothetical protein